MEHQAKRLTTVRQGTGGLVHRNSADRPRIVDAPDPRAPSVAVERPPSSLARAPWGGGRWHTHPLGQTLIVIAVGRDVRRRLGWPPSRTSGRATSSGSRHNEKHLARRVANHRHVRTSPLQEKLDGKAGGRGCENTSLTTALRRCSRSFNVRRV
jgi:hypothetical protein